MARRIVPAGSGWSRLARSVIVNEDGFMPQPLPGREDVSELPSAGEDPRPPVRIPGATVLAIGFAAGIAVGWHCSRPVIWPWLFAGATTVILAAALSRRRGAAMILSVAMACLGAAWANITQHHVAQDDLAGFMGDAAELVHVRGVATRAPELRRRTTGSMARFDYRKPATYFPMRVKALVDRSGVAKPLRGTVLVRVDESLPPFRAGDVLDVRGFLMLPPSPRNPGEFDLRKYARSLGQAGILSVPSRELVVIEPRMRGGMATAILNWRDELRRRAGAWLLADLPESNSSQRDWLLVNLLLGERESQIDGWYEAFQRVGLAHILAISGFHLAVLAGFVLVVARLIGGSSRGHGWLVIGVVLLYLFLVEVRMPVLRAGVMTIAASLGLVFGRHLRAGGLVSLSAILLLLWRPDELFNPGFQLTYGVVLGLIHLVPPVRRRWFGRPNAEAATIGQMLGEWLKTALVVSIVAWLVATPMALYHFGMISPLGAPLSVIAVPLSAVLLAVGYTKMVLSAFLPSAAMLLGIPLSIGADLLLAIVRAMDDLPWSVLHAPYPSVMWSIAALAWVCWWCLARRRFGWRRAAMWAACAGIVAWAALPALRSTSPSALRVDMLAVGDGSCYVVRGRESTVLFDAGSSSNLDAGRRTIIPALRRLGVRSVDAIVISHADLDHYSAVLEIVDEFDVGAVHVTPQFVSAADQGASSPAAHVMDALTSRRVAVKRAAAGDVLELGSMRWTWLHPPASDEFQRDNDSSMVVLIEAAAHRVLLCGDIQQEAIARLLRACVDLRADIVELPHHGSFNEEAIALLRTVDPSVVMQSTGWSRWQRDRWASELAHRRRLVTARDGACWVEVTKDGELSTGRFVAQGADAGGAENP
jgi:competence protein ComEC